jgi:hypothetical protein
MKTTATLIITALCFILISCRKDNLPAYQSLTAKKDGIGWQASGTTTGTGFKPMGTKDTLVIGAHEGEQNLNIAIAQKGKGNYSGGQIKASFHETVGYDVIVESYRLKDVPGNSVIITEYDESRHTLKGTFTLTLKSTRDAKEVKFTNGKFNLELKDQYYNPYMNF